MYSIIGILPVFQSLFYHNNITQTILEMTQFKMSHGTFDPLSIIYRLNTAYNITYTAVHVLSPRDEYPTKEE